MALSLVGGAFAFTGCTDYEDDIKALDDRVSALESTVADLQSQIEAGAVITSVTQSDNGITVTLSNGQSYEITNGKDGANGADGADGSVVEIGENGNWYIDGEDTGMPSRGEKGDKGDKGDQGDKGEPGAPGEPGKDAPTVYYEPGTEGTEEGFWVKVTEVEGQDPLREVTDITWLPEGTLTAVWDSVNQVLRIYNAEGAGEEPVVIPLSTGMVTSVELVLSYNGGNGANFNLPSVTFSTAIEKENIFEEKGLNDETIANQIPFKAGAQFQTGESVLVRVSPVNAVLTEDMISFVNSNGDNLDELVKVVDVNPYKGLLTRSDSNTGLWKVDLELVNYNETAFNNATTAKVNGDTKDILFAVQVNNTDSDASRYVTSSYDLTFAWQKYTAASSLNFVVSNSENEVKVADINNRYSFYEKGNWRTPNPSLPDYGGKDKPADQKNEYTWSGSTAVSPIYQGQVNVKQDDGDDRSGKAAFPAVQGEEITISLLDENGEEPTNIRAMYVTLDKKANAVESQPSEWNSWNNYEYTGLNTVVEGTSVTITIDGTNIINDFIGFRVFAVNYDGTLVDPDGKAFYVKVGDQRENWNEFNTVVVPSADQTVMPNEVHSNNVSVSLSKLTGADHATWYAEDGKTDPIFNVAFDTDNNDANGVAYTTVGGESNISYNDFNKVTRIYTVPTYDGTTDETWADIEDDKTYTGTLTIYNADNFVLATVTVTMTKELPTTAPAGFSIKSNQLDANGVYNCYLVPDTWAANSANVGTMFMDDVFNWGEDGVETQYTVVFAAAADGPNNTVIPVVAYGGDKVAGAQTGSLSVSKKYIDNETQHTTTVIYNYGKISSKLVDDDDPNNDYYTIIVDYFPTVFNCIYNDTYTWHWATIDELAADDEASWFVPGANGANVAEAPSTELVYGTDYQMSTAVDPTRLISFDMVILGESARDSRYDAWLWQPYGTALTPSQASLDFVSAEVVSNDNGVSGEYFDVEGTAGSNLRFVATQTSTETNPTAPVESTLVLTYADMYGHEVVIELPMTVVPR